MEAVSQQTSSSAKISTGPAPNDDGQAATYNGNLNVIPPPTGPDNANTRISSYIEYNDGKVCWYYPIFPELFSTAVAPDGSPEERFRNLDGYEDFYYHDGESMLQAPHHQPSYDYFDAGAAWGDRDFCFDDDWMFSATTYRERRDSWRAEPHEAQTKIPDPQYYNHSLIYGSPAERFPIGASSQQSISYKYLPNNQWDSELNK